MDGINILLNPRLLQALQPLLPLLPPSLSPVLADHLASQSSPATIPYSLLLSISRWSRTSEGQLALDNHDPSLDTHSYDMVSLLAGTITSPERRFPSHKRGSSPDEDARRDVNDRKAVIAVANSLLSIVGAGVAAWWAGDVVEWRNEWKVLFALFIAAVVAFAEGVLFIIWDSRRSKPPFQSRVVRQAAHKKDRDEDEKQEDVVVVSNSDGILRRRAQIETDSST